MPATTTYNLPYLGDSDPPDIPQLGEGLAEAVEDELVRVDAELVVLDDERPRIATADQADTSGSTTLQSDAVLTAAVAANTRYGFDALILYSAAATADFNYGFAIPASSTLNWSAVKLSPSDVFEMIHATGLTASDALNSAGGGGTGVVRTVVIRGTIRTTGTAGSLTFRFAKANSEATVATRRADSWLAVRQAR